MLRYACRQMNIRAFNSIDGHGGIYCDQPSEQNPCLALNPKATTRETQHGGCNTEFGGLVYARSGCNRTCAGFEKLTDILQDTGGADDWRLPWSKCDNKHTQQTDYKMANPFGGFCYEDYGSILSF